MSGWIDNKIFKVNKACKIPSGIGNVIKKSMSLLFQTIHISKAHNGRRWKITFNTWGSKDGGRAPSWKSCGLGPSSPMFRRKLRSVHCSLLFSGLLSNSDLYQLIARGMLGKSLSIAVSKDRMSSLLSGSKLGSNTCDVSLALRMNCRDCPSKAAGHTSKGSWHKAVDDISLFTKQKRSFAASPDPGGDLHARGARSQTLISLGKPQWF